MSTTTTTTIGRDAELVVLAEKEWRRAQSEHRRVTAEWSAPRLARRQKGERHPVDDFLWEYYPIRPAQLQRWSPGLGVALAGDATQFLSLPGFATTAHGVVIDPSQLPQQRKAAERIAELLSATQARPGRFGCFALHEWAMVYDIDQSALRHAAYPLRLAPNEVRGVVDELGLRCTHFDAFRFYTDAARPLNPLQLTRADQVEHEQPGCLHANMDLFKWAWQLFPGAAADLVRATRQLTAEVRWLDMRAAPYDLRTLGVVPLHVETTDGRAEFVAAQRGFAERAAGLRGELLTVASALLSA